ncbi:uncharacterized protein EV422DRAFT_511395 [Fimicolochytrium jonesii]|uniref:uncharacterized protein n=1 Tax=Fimicolochytrium jonesii TaxID=1396493 RepID=UPI0022FE8A85|nr:uncharacterized protein EV422DRAFT_511395 [Fimicolochytrium jonesii]KAI8826777.1 hypothetical protein EV422DRAFT_511395 [Fimicolochytrium jonesii]
MPPNTGPPPTTGNLSWDQELGSWIPGSKELSLQQLPSPGQALSFSLKAAGVGFLVYCSWKGYQWRAYRKKVLTIQDGTILKWKLSRNPVVEVRSDDGLLGKLSGAGQRNITLFEALETLRWARDDGRIKGLEMDFSTGSRLLLASKGMGFAQMQELHEAIRSFGDAKRCAFGDNCRLVAFTDTFDSQDHYFLSTAFDEVKMEPNGVIPLYGFAPRSPFLGNLLKKLGIDMIPLSKGKCKGATEHLTETKYPPQILDNLASLFASLTDQFRRQIASSRDVGLKKFTRQGMNKWRGMSAASKELSPASSAADASSDQKVKALMDVAPLTTGEGVEAGLIDRIAYKREQLHRGPDSDVKEMPLTRYKFLRAAEVKREVRKMPSDQKVNVALVYLSGAIKEGEGQFGPDKVAKAILDAAADKSIRAIVFRIDTGGGGMWASDTIRDAVDHAQKTYNKPIIASYGNAAASGGVWISINCKKILASPGTITGSIGIAYARPIFTPEFLDRFGITVDERLVLTDGAKGSSVFTPPTGRALERWKSLMDGYYQTFLRLVAAGRGMTVEQVASIAEGKVYTGEQALKLGLIDELGGLQSALRVAVAHSGAAPTSLPIVQIFPRPQGLIQKLVENGTVDDMLGSLSIDMQASLAAAAARVAVGVGAEVVEERVGVGAGPALRMQHLD